MSESKEWTPKPTFESADDAYRALQSDKLGTVYRSKGEVFVVTAHGSGTFSADEWERVAGKPRHNWRALPGVRA